TVISATYPANALVDRPSKTSQNDEMYFAGINIPVNVRDIGTFERRNTTSAVSVFDSKRRSISSIPQQGN
ncbi:hypothetical protein CHS0354_011340, partial [Potamilus streckersoni]